MRKIEDHLPEFLHEFEDSLSLHYVGLGSHGRSRFFRSYPAGVQTLVSQTLRGTAVPGETESLLHKKIPLGGYDSYQEM